MQAHWTRGRPDEARHLLASLDGLAQRPVECAWVAAQDRVTLELLQELFPDLATLRGGRRLPIWQQQVQLADLARGEALGNVWVYLEALQTGAAPELPPGDHAYLQRLHAETLSRAAVEGKA